MKMISRLLIGISIGGITNGLLWGGFCAIMAVFYDGLKEGLQNGWIFLAFLSFGIFGGFYGAIIGFFVSLINARKIVSAIGGGLAAFVVIIFINIFDGISDKNSTLVNFTFMPLVLSFFTAFSCYLIVTVLNRISISHP